MDQIDFVDQIRQIKEKFTVRDLLRRFGNTVPDKDGVIICPLPGHNDSGPSFSISQNGTLYKCFGCKESGDVFTLWRLLNGGTFLDALRALGDLAGVRITLDDDSRAAFEAARQRRSAYQDAAEYLSEQLMSPEGAPALSYLQSRGIGKDTCEATMVGFNPGWDTLKKHLNAKKHSDDALRQAGILSETKDYRWLDFAPKCIVFSFLEVGETRFMRGRSLPDATGPKARSLNVAKNGSSAVIPALYYPGGRRPHKNSVVVLVEGEMDALSVHQAVKDADAKYVVACIFGTGTPPQRVASELEAAGRVVLMLDADTAGRDAAAKLACELGESAYAVGLEYQDDPNAHLQKVGRERFAAQVVEGVEQSRPFIESVIDEIEAAGLSPLAHAEAFKKRIVPLLGALPETHVDVYMEPLSKRLGLQKRTIRTSLNKHKEDLVSKADSDAARKDQSDVDLAMAALEDRILPLYYERSGTCTTICMFSKARREVLRVPCRQKAEVVSALSPDLGPYDPATYLCKRIEGLTPMKAEGVLLKAMQSLSSRICPKSDLERLAEGVHFTSEGIVMVSGRDAFLSTDGHEWTRLIKPTLADKYLIDPHAPSDRWLPFTLDELNQPLVYEPKEVAEHFFHMLSRFWVFAVPQDAWLHTFMPFALSISKAWRRKPLLHIMAPSGSGKTKLVQGWYAGKELEGTPGWVLPIYFNSDLSGAGVVARLDGTALTLFMDEWESDEGARTRVNDVLRYIRSAISGGAGSLRGTQSRGFIEQKLDVSAVAASIQEFDRVADTNRWLPSQLAHLEPAEAGQESFPNPEACVGDYLRKNKLDYREMQRTVLTGLMPQVAEMRRMVSEFTTDPRISSLGVTTRFLENMVQPAAIAEACGYDGVGMLEDWVSAHRVDYRDIAEAREERELIRALMHSSFLVNGTHGNYTTTLAAMVCEKGRHNRIEQPGLGIWSGGNPLSDNETIRINWTSAANTILKHTRFSSWSSARLTKEAQHSKAYLKNATHALGGANGAPRVSVFSAKVLREEFFVDMVADIPEEQEDELAL